MKLIVPIIMFRFFLVFYVFVFSSVTYSVEVTDLYTAKIAVNSQGSNERNQALKKAMAAVLVKVGGQQDVLQSNEIKPALSQFNSYISQYRYSREQNTTKLIAQFDEDKINQLFINANLPLWGSLRPQVLLWLIEEQGLERTIMSASASSDIPQIINDFSQTRGLPVLLPLMDLTEITTINVTDFWGRFITPIEQASARYIADMAVVVRVSNQKVDEDIVGQQQENSNCQPLCEKQPFVIDWSLISDGKLLSSKSMSYLYQGLDKKALLEQAMADITQVIYQRYALSTKSEQQYVIDVANIEDMATYVDLVEFLQDLSSVKNVQLQAVKGNNRRFSLELIGSKQAFLAALKLNKQLAQFVDPLAAKDPEAVPVFLWEQR
ncbi:DUF2066 domain-containing protein [Thalassotalea sp. PLHSN55]|uniref:DUF2066 domain-containing protein n=1 Tax=Thalassotalea sp. PLHSN55 TaxID=3435888 RepID=UPI003F87AB3E